MCLWMAYHACHALNSTCLRGIDLYVHVNARKIQAVWRYSWQLYQLLLISPLHALVQLGHYQGITSGKIRILKITVHVPIKQLYIWSVKKKFFWFDGIYFIYLFHFEIILLPVVLEMKYCFFLKLLFGHYGCTWSSGSHVKILDTRNSDKKQIHYWELANIRLLHTKFSHCCDLVPRICASLLSFKCIIQMVV